MKYMIPLIMALAICTICRAQHFSDFGGLSPGFQDNDFHIPATHTFQVLIEEGEDLQGGGALPGTCDFAGYVPRQNSSKYGYLSINSEEVPGGVTILDLEFDDVLGKWIIQDSNAVNFEFNILAESIFPNQVGSTIANCSGAVTPWNTIISCEEYTVADIQKDYPNTELFFKVDGQSNGYDVYGWAIEIDPATKTVIDQDGGRMSQDKLWAMGNFKHENAVVHGNNRTIYQGADDTTGEGYLFKFVADESKNLSSGDLYVYKGDKESVHSWVRLENSTVADQNSTLEQCAAIGATSFGGIEDVEINPIDGMVYFAVKRETTGIFTNQGIIYRFKDTDELDGSGIENFEIYAGNRSYEILPGVSEDWGQGNDNLLFDSLGNLWVAQDGGNNFIWVVYDGHTQTDPKVKIFGRTPAGSEPTGLTFSPDEKYIFMSIQHPSSSNNATTQNDAVGRSVAFDKDVVLVIAREEHLGNDQTTADQSIMITQYYHDSDSGSKWLELTNISDELIAGGTYFLNLYDNGSPDEILNAPPKAIEGLPAMDPGEVLLLKNSSIPAFPLAQNIGNADQTISSVAEFDDNDVIIITSSPGIFGYKNRRDILGNIDAQAWGENMTLIRGANSSELPERDFNSLNWITLDSLQEVSTANKDTNLALGTQEIGKTVWDGSSWSRLLPDRTRAALIEADLSAGDSDFRAYDLEISADSGFRFENQAEGSNKNIFVYGNLSVLGELVIGDTESLIFKNDSPQVNGEIVKKETSVNHSDIFDITYWSSPVLNATTEEVFYNVDPGRIFYFVQSEDTTGDPQSDTYWNAWVNAEGSMDQGRGYAAQGPLGQTGPHQLEFKGPPNFGTIIFADLVFQNDDGSNENANNDYNLIGNPYPSAIDIDEFIDNNPNIDGTVYLWTHATAYSNGSYNESDYAVYNRIGGVAVQNGVEVSSNIGSGQGFFVRAIDAGNLVFDPGMIIPGANDQFFKMDKEKKSELDRIWINLFDDQGSFEQILIGFSEKATIGLDNGYDALYLEGGNSIGFFSLIQDKKLVIQGLGQFTGDEVIDLGLTVWEEPFKMTISIDRTEGILSDSRILLEDTDSQILHDLVKGDYNFSVSQLGEFKTRFKLHFKESALSSEDAPIQNSVEIYQQGQNLILESVLKVNKLEIFDVLGRKIMEESQHFDKSIFSLDIIPSGTIYLVRVQLENGTETSKRLIKF